MAGVVALSNTAEHVCALALNEVRQRQQRLPLDDRGAVTAVR